MMLKASSSVLLYVPIDKDYKYALVWDSLDYLWILSREKQSIQLRRRIWKNQAML
jgi:lipocalin